MGGATTLLYTRETKSNSSIFEYVRIHEELLSLKGGKIDVEEAWPIEVPQTDVTSERS